MTAAVLGLGGNIGEPREAMAAAIRSLSDYPSIAVFAVSPLYRTPPWGKTDQPDFLNAAVKVETTLTPQVLLQALLTTERDLGRERNERWGPRTIDIDILIYGDEAVDEPGLHIPHPRLTERAFALAPLADLIPDLVLKGRPVKDWLAESDSAGMTRIAEAGWQLES